MFCHVGVWLQLSVDIAVVVRVVVAVVLVVVLPVVVIITGPEVMVTGALLNLHSSLYRS